LGGVAGSTLMSGVAPTLTASQSGVAWSARIVTTWYSTTEAVTFMELSIGVTNATTASPKYVRSTDTTGLTTTGANDMVLTVKWGTATAANTVTRHAYVARRLA
jgi:hypothetical protein